MKKKKKFCVLKYEAHKTPAENHAKCPAAKLQFQACSTSPLALTVKAQVVSGSASKFQVS